jgi:hypothetical protein
LTERESNYVTILSEFEFQTHVLFLNKMEVLMSVFFFWASIVLLVIAFAFIINSDGDRNNLGVMSFICLLLAVIPLVANAFSNDVDENNFAIHRDGQNLVVQSTPGTYWGYYQAYHFARKARYCKIKSSFDSLGQMEWPESGCVNYVLIPENFPKTIKGKFTGLSYDNDDTEKNTATLISEYKGLSHSTFIIATPEKN